MRILEPVSFTNLLGGRVDLPSFMLVQGNWRRDYS
jgi:hypothetical protein